jgi:feruloyl esterase
MRCKLSFLAILLPAAFLIGCEVARDDAPADGNATTKTGPACSIESIAQLPDVRIISVVEEATPVPHCKVAGVIGTETNFELLLPDDWNGKFVMGGGGGFVGSIVNAAQDLWGALQMGYATVGTDTGHQGHSLTADWALNNLERLVNFGHVAVHRTAVTSKALTEDYYGQDIAHSYFVGCSRGGGQALMEAQRYPEDFEGIVAAAPAYDWTHEMGARWLRIAQHMYPDPTQIAQPVIGADALKLIGDAVMAHCDDLDGLTDGVLNDPRQCDFDVSSLACANQVSDACLSPDQVAAADAIYSDFEIDGQVIPGTPVGAELPGWPVGWELWTAMSSRPRPFRMAHGPFRPEYFASFSTTIRTGVMPATTLRTFPRKRLASRRP